MLHFRRKFKYIFFVFTFLIHRSLTLHSTVFFTTTHSPPHSLRLPVNPPPSPVYLPSPFSGLLNPPHPFIKPPSRFIYPFTHPPGYAPQFTPPSLPPLYSTPLAVGRGGGKKLEGREDEVETWHLFCKFLAKFAK